MATRKQIAKWLPEMWWEYNALCFDGKLRLPTFTVNAADDHAGLWTAKGKRQNININPRLVKNKRDLRVVLVHEMIHQLQWMQKSERTRNEQHGRFFIAHAFRIICDHHINVRIYFEKS